MAACLMVAAVLLLSAAAHADGGAVAFQQVNGPFAVTVFVAPTPLRAGPVDISVLVQTRASNEPVLDANVELALTPATASAVAIRVAATREQATNKLLYAAVVDLPSAGAWDVQVAIRRGPEGAEVGSSITLAAALPPLLAFWPYLAFPPIAVLLFVLHQWLRSRSSKAS